MSEPKKKKTGGRVAGVPNKITQEMREAIRNLLNEYSDSGLMREDFCKLKPYERVTLAEKLLQYTTPKLQSVAIADNGERKLTIEHKLAQLAADNDI